MSENYIPRMFSLFFPPSCLACRSTLNSSKKKLCPPCEEGVRLIQGTVCPRCGEPYPSEETVPHLCSACLERERPFQGGRSIGFYEGTLLELLHRWKYEKGESVGPFLAGLMLEKASPSPWIPSPKGGEN
ncbi:MAG: double zinc ribbon domain-containing protein, partial [bacterium]|nr:double zinc ribbon domain-containing protein [bacterium]